MISSKLLYGIELYGDNPDYILKRIQLLQNYFLKLILRRNKISCTITLHKDAEILFIKDHCKFRLSLLIFDRLNKENLPLYLKNFKITSKKELNNYSTRNSKLYIPNDRNNYNNLTVQLRALLSLIHI